MHLRVTRIRRGDKTYEYSQLVESVRTPGGGVTKKVIASLGQLGELARENLIASLAATRQNQRVSTVVAVPREPQRADASLRFLDLAVLLDVWRRSGLEAFMRTAFGRSGTSLADADVLAALVLHRCVAARSKLHAERWLPTTALPELLEIPTDAFNNTRIHRVLDRLHDQTPDLMRKLPGLFGFPERKTQAFYLDLTDTWFTGQGPKLAKKGWTKDGIIRKKIGVALLCSDSGLPLRWEVVTGGSAEAPVMLDLLRHEPLMRKTSSPVIVDRALGYTEYIEELLNAGILFLTALRRWEVRRYAPELPTDETGSLPVPALPDAKALAPVCRIVTEAGMERLTDDLYARDLGIIEPVDGVEEPTESDAVESPLPSSQSEATSSVASKAVRVLGSGRRALEVGRAIVAEVASGEAPSNAEAGRRRGLEPPVTRLRVKLTRLAESVQTEVLAGRAEHVGSQRLGSIVSLPADTQLDALREAEHRGRTSSRGGPWRAADDTSAMPGPIQQEPVPRVRLVAYFNPEMWHEQRTHAARRLDRFHLFVTQLNDKLKRPSSARRTEVQVRTAIARHLDRAGHVAAFDVEVDRVAHEGRHVLQATITPNDDWRRRRSLDGYFVLVAHPDVQGTAADLIRRYRDKDIVEQDFKVMKSLLRLRPVWHHNDSKVRAHVTLCMLALTVTRLLEERLGKGHTFAAVRETLETCTLQRYQGTSRASQVYGATRPDQAQTEILRKLGLAQITDPQHLATAITPRHLL